MNLRGVILCLLAQPNVELYSLTGAHDAKKLLHELIYRLCHSACLAQSQQFLLLFLRQLLKGRHKEPNDLFD